MGLETYWQKRDFGRTPEPRGRPGEDGLTTAGEGLRYVIQKHDATRLHYDFRLEHDGVLLSWAVPKGPSLVAGERRLAVMTEDHPLEYGDFEGTIPEDEYGGGTVMLWDVGTWEPVTREGIQPIDVASMLQRGKLKFTLHGDRLRGAFTLVRLKGKEERDADRTWLLLKQADDFARDDGDALLDESLTSITSGRTLEEIRAGSSTWHSNKPRERVAPRGPFVALPTPAAELPGDDVGDAGEGGAWLYEPVLDGVRVLVRVTPDGASASGVAGDPVALPPEADLRGLMADATLDATLRPDGSIVVSDLLALDGDDMTSLPLSLRRAALGALVAASEIEPATLSLAPNTTDRPVAVTWGEVVAKRLDAPYHIGRTRDWLIIGTDV